MDADFRSKKKTIFDTLAVAAIWLDHPTVMSTVFKH